MEINKARLIEQIKQDEGFSPKAFWDIKQFTYGYGCKAPDKGATITKEAATKILTPRVEQSINEFNLMFKGHEQKFNGVRAEAFINILFNMGMGKKGHTECGGLYSFKNTLGLIFNTDNPNWQFVSDNLSKSLWHRQVGSRAIRIEKEIATGIKEGEDNL